MTQEKFWELWDAKALNFKCYRYENRDAHDGDLAWGDVVAFEYEGKYYIRYARYYKPMGWVKKRSPEGAMELNGRICEFQSRENANHFFKRFFSDFRKVF